MRTQRLLWILAGVGVATAVSGCAIIGSIFKAGAVTGVVGVVMLAGVVLLIVSRLGKSG